jgi:ribonuclease R
LLDFLRDNPGLANRRGLARAFRLKGPARQWLTSTLKDLIDAGAIVKSRGRLQPAGELAPVDVLEVAAIDVDGELIARPVTWKADVPPPTILLAPPAHGRGLGQIGIGDRVLARLTRIGPGRYEGRLIRRVHAEPKQILGIFTEEHGRARIAPTDRRQRDQYTIAPSDRLGARPGELVLAETLGEPAYGPPRVRIIERLGHMRDPRALSLIAIHTHDLPCRFSDAALDEADRALVPSLEGRADLRHVPLVTIDPSDARDRDDAVFAESDDDPANAGGFRIIVAIADVAHYVRPGSALDKDARERGNSAYFPDRVVPMLPETLSGGLCSLAPGQDRACLALLMTFDAKGNKLRHRFVRGLMRSRAALSYAQAQRAHEGAVDEATGPLAGALDSLFAAYAALKAARDRRHPLAIELAERRVQLAEDGSILGIRPEPRFDSHRLIEECMIAANVAAAETLEELKAPCIYRVHEEPARDKVASLQEFLESLGFRLAKGQPLRPALFNRILSQARGGAHDHLVNEVVLRTQAQAFYSPNNNGHFGLALRRYAHFTSPIRRYADLLVHRSLIAALKLGTDGIGPTGGEDLDRIAQHISATERRAMTAERDAVDRFTAAFMAERVGASFVGRINGVTRFGLFVELEETGANGLVPMRSLGPDFFVHQEHKHALVGRRTGQTYRLGDPVEVELIEADPVTGSLRFALIDVLTPRKARVSVPRGRRRR